MNEPDFIAAHKHSSRHRTEIEESNLCGCFYCLQVFEPSIIDFWIDDKTTAMCPRCGIDSVIGSKSGYPLTVEFLQQMKNHWFG